MSPEVLDAVTAEPVDVESPRAALAKLEPVVTDALVLQREPSAVLAEASKAAKALMTVMAAKPKKVIMNGEQYIENEDWLTIGHFYGVTAKIESDRYCEFGTVHGWEATAILVARDGREIGRATAMCLDDEEKWSTRAKKEWAYCLGKEDDCSKHGHSVEDPGRNLIVWVPNPNKPGKMLPKKTRITTGEEKVPLFQLRSMAQTRASSKVHASVLRFVPVLAGFKGTPAEELPDAQHVAQSEPVIQIQHADDAVGDNMAEPSLLSDPATPDELGVPDPPPPTITRPSRPIGPADLEHLPKDAVLLLEVGPGFDPACAELATHLSQKYPIFAKPVAVMARDCCQRVTPVTIQLQTSPEGTTYVKKLTRVTSGPF